MNKFLELLFFCSVALALEKASYQKNVEVHKLPSDTRISNGLEAVRNQFPYQVSLQELWEGTYYHNVGGSLISTTIVVTAAHIFPTNSTYKVVAGILNLNETTEFRQERFLKDVIPHPEWNISAAISPNDIAVVKVDEPFEWSLAVLPIFLPQPHQNVSGIAILSGWGYLNDVDDIPNNLHFAFMELITYTECENMLISILGNTNGLDPKMRCTAAPFNISSCGGDSGGPLVHNGVLVGTASWAVTPCGWPNAPTVYTDVTLFIDFIQQSIKKLE